jgi:hypothetical protein
MSEKDNEREVAAEDATGGMSRRQLLTAGLAAAGAGLTSVPASAHGENGPLGPVGVAESGSTAVEFRAHLTQTGPTGEHFVAFGYLTRVEGASDSLLFGGATPGETTALLTAYASGDLSRRVHDGSVHSIDIEGTLTIYERPVSGASWDDPDSFKFGDPVATFAVDLLDVLTVFAPGQGLPTLNGDLEQTWAGHLNGRRGPKFGQVGSRSRLLATGLGTLTNAASLNAVFEMGGNWSTK